MAKELSLLLVGATGAVGQAVLRQALAEKRITRIVAPTRRPLEAGFVGNPRLLNPVIDFARLPEEAAWWKVDAVVCTLGTTIKVAGSQAAFAAVDRDLLHGLAGDEILAGVGIDKSAQAALDVGLGNDHR